MSSLTRREMIGGLGALAVQSTVLAQTLSSSPQPGPVILKNFEFSSGSGGMLAGFCDYNLTTGSLDFIAEVRPLPPGIHTYGANRQAYFLSGNNRPDDLFMVLKGIVTRADGIVPGQLYTVSFDIKFASNANDCPGSGGSPASVFLKAGGNTVEPVTKLLADGYVTINIDKGEQMTGGKDMGLIGSIWNGTECPEEEWILLRRFYTHPFPIEANPRGELWLAVGTESGYEATTGVYYYSIKTVLTPV
jgi:hypothetical protein